MITGPIRKRINSIEGNPFSAKYMTRTSEHLSRYAEFRMCELGSVSPQPAVKVFSNMVPPINLKLYFIVQVNLIAGLSTKTPIGLWGFGNGHFKIVRSQPQYLIDSLKQQMDQAFLGLNRSALKHADFDDRVARRSASGIIKIIGF